MHEATITIKKIWPVFKFGDKRTTIEDADGNKWRIEVDRIGDARDGETRSVGYTEESFQGKSYKLIKNMKPLVSAAGNIVSAAASGKSLNGPEKGMMIRETFLALLAGKSKDQILNAWLDAEAIYHTIKDGPPYQMSKGQDFNDSLDDTF